MPDTMRTPLRSESEAYRFVLAGVLVIAACILIGWLTEALVGAVLFAIALVLGAIAYLRAEDPDRRMPLRAAVAEPHRHGAPSGKRHVLVIANEALSGSGLRERILAGDGERVEVDILAPILTSPLHYSVSDIDRELERARARLQRSLAWASEQGIVARGEVGDPSTASAIEDELRDFGADEVIVVTHPREQQSWQERGELTRLRDELDVPITHVVVGATGPSADEAQHLADEGQDLADEVKDSAEELHDLNEDEHDGR